MRVLFFQDDNRGTRSHWARLAAASRAIGRRRRRLLKRISTCSVVRASHGRVRHLTRAVRARIRRVSGGRAMGRAGRRLVKRVSWSALERFS